jgi:hypothetical protein
MSNYPYQYPYTPQPQSYGNPYQDRLNAMQPRLEIVTVNGEPGARAYPMPPNSRTLLLDENAPIIWLAQTDGAGYKTVTPYTITPYQQEEPVDAKSLEARIKRLEDMINEKSHTGQATHDTGAADAI